MPHKEREDLVRINEGSIAVDGAYAIAIAIGAECRIVFSCADGLARGFDVRLDRLGVNASETWIAGSANFIAGDAITGEQLVKQAGRGAVHGVTYETEFCVAQALPVDQFFDRIQIRSARLERLN
jgi:hypothetical protein